MDLYYIFQINGNSALLAGDEFHHAVKVMRRGKGDILAFTDGKGSIYMGVLSDVRKREATIEIREQTQAPAPAYHVTLAISPTKNIKRTEWCLEKVTEMGVKTIIPMICQRAERRKVPMERLQKILVAAMKQSQSAYLPELTVAMSFEKAMEYQTWPTTRYICFRSEEAVALPAHYPRGSDVGILVGPEGDFTEEESTLAQSKGFVPLTLGDRRLRTETAGVVAVVGIHTLNQ